MDGTAEISTPVEDRIASRLKALRNARGWSLDEMARRSGVSRATLSRIENREVSPTTAVLGKLCSAYGVTMSWLMVEVERDFTPLIRAADQALWTDPETGFRRTTVSPPAQGLSGEAIACTLPAGARLAYDAPSRPGAEHHLLMLDGTLDITQGDLRAVLHKGDCLRWKSSGPSAFMTPPETGARYLLFVV
jgi:transcriptional regulator with XRE-family HTH domain